MKCKPEEDQKDTEKAGKENYKLTLGFIKSLTSKLSKSNIVISSDEEKAAINKEISSLSSSITEFKKKHGIK